MPVRFMSGPPCAGFIPDDMETSNGLSVDHWLRSLGLVCYAKAFYENGYDDLQICRNISAEDLDCIGVLDMKDRRDIMAAVFKLRQGSFYFVLEPEPRTETKTSELPRPGPGRTLVVRSLLSEELRKDKLRLDSPTFTLPNGVLADLRDVAELYADRLHLPFSEVLEELEHIRINTLPLVVAESLVGNGPLPKSSSMRNISQASGGSSESFRVSDRSESGGFLRRLSTRFKRSGASKNEPQGPLRSKEKRGQDVVSTPSPRPDELSQGGSYPALSSGSADTSPYRRMPSDRSSSSDTSSCSASYVSNNEEDGQPSKPLDKRRGQSLFGRTLGPKSDPKNLQRQASDIILMNSTLHYQDEFRRPSVSPSVQDLPFSRTLQEKRDSLAKKGNSTGRLRRSSSSDNVRYQVVLSDPGLFSGGPVSQHVLPGPISRSAESPDDSLPAKNWALIDILRRRLLKENIDLGQPPYCGKDGAWNVPVLLVRRYSEELRADPEMVVREMDVLRAERAQLKGLSTIRLRDDQIRPFLASSPVTAHSTISDWLIHLGLPIYISDFVEGNIDMSSLVVVNEVDLIALGITDQRHVDMILKACDLIRTKSIAGGRRDTII